MTNDILLFTLDITAASQEIQLLGGRITQQFTPYIFVAILPDMSDIDKLRYSREQQYGPLDDKSKIAFDAWHLFQAKLSAKKDIIDLTEGLPWDAPGFEPPLKLGASDIGGDEILGTTGTATSLYLIGSVAMGLVIVSSTMPGLSFTYDETIKTVAEVMEGLQFLTHAEAKAKVSFVYNIHINTIDEIPPPPDFCGDKYDPCEAIWRDPVLQQLGFPPKEESLVTFANQLKDNNKTDWSFVAFFTKYPLYHFAYAGGVRSCMQYSNGAWGPDNIHRVFAHEVAHIFGAADEYQASNCSCNPSGYLQIANKNCVNCAAQHVPCLMDQNTLSICEWSRKQLGWSSKFFDPLLLKQISPVCDNKNNVFVCAVDIHNTAYIISRYFGVWGSWERWNNVPDLQFITTLWDYSDSVHVFGISTDNTLYVNKRSNNKWGGWQANWYQAPRLASISAFTDRDNNVYVFGIAPDNIVYLNRHHGDSWSGWQSDWYNPPKLISINAVTTRNNNLYIFGIGTDNTVYLNRHEKDDWSGWQYNWNAAPKLKSIVPIVDVEDNVFVFGIGTDNTVHVNFRSGRTGRWEGWETGYENTPKLQFLTAATDNGGAIYLWGIMLDGTSILNTSTVAKQWTHWNVNWGKPDDFYKPNLHFITAIFDRINVPHVWGVGVNNYVMGNNNIEYFNWRNGNNWNGWEYQWYM